mgnify:CR=1 FL=1|jgi:DNA-binding GntR family transcriptional regulator
MHTETRSPTFALVRPAAIRSNVVTALRQALIEGKYAPGAELSDSSLATELGISRGPVREALLILSEEGIVTHSHNRGFAVPSLTSRDITQINRTRYPLEVLALELARENVGPEDLRRLSDLKSAMLEAFDVGGLPATAAPNFAFHCHVWELAGDPWLLAALRRVCTSHFVYISAYKMGLIDHSRDLLDEMHQRCIDYLAGDSSETAMQCVTFHLRPFGEKGKESVKNSGQTEVAPIKPKLPSAL